MRDYRQGFALTNCLLPTCLCIGFWTSPVLSSDKLTIAHEGKTPYVVVQADQATDSEKLASRELTTFLGRVTGASFPVVKESALSRNVPCIYVGWTKYMTANGIEGAKLGEEEWIIRSVGNSLILTGGRPRGTLYAVYEFLENQVGCHWLDRNTEVVPARPTLMLLDLQIQGKPTFWGRDIYLSYEAAMPTDDMAERQKMFLVRNKSTSPICPAGGFYNVFGSPGNCHTFSNYVNASKWFQSHPEYFSLNAKGQRVPAKDGAGPGQLCLTNPDVRRLTLESLRAFIAKDRAEAAKSGCRPPRIYDISQNDVYDGHCKCANCRAIVAREGGESGPVIDFINAIAESIEKDYPDILIQTFAYNLTEKPPKTLKPRHNVIVRWCDVYSVVDLLRPLSHPSNAKNYEELLGWGKIAPHLAIWDYWLPFSPYMFPTPNVIQAFPTPYCMIQCMGPDLKLFADADASTMFCESEQECEAGENFPALKTWLGHQLMVNAYRPVEPLIRIFMEGYYGAAASKIEAYLTYLEERIDKDAGKLVIFNAPHKLEYLDLDFFSTVERLFDEAESLVKKGRLDSLHVQQERLVVDGALLYLWPWLEKRLAIGAKMPFDHETVVRRYETDYRANLKAFYSKKTQALREVVIAQLAMLFRDPKLPEPFRTLPSRDVADFNRLTFSAWGRTFLPDSDAVGGMAVCFAADKETQQKPLSFGATSGATVTLKPEEIPQDGKYHLLKIGRINVRQGTAVWACSVEGVDNASKGWGVTVDRLFVPNAKDAKVNDWDAYISLKVKGPAYVKGSTEANGIWMDRVLLVKPQKE